MTQAPPPADLTLQRSSRDPETMRAQLTAWLATELPPGADPVVVLHTAIQENGLSSETVLLDATWTEDGQQRAGEYVARVAPAAEDLPVFESYALQDQYDAIRIVGETDRGARPGSPLDRADRRRARHPVLPDGPDRRPRPARRAALQLRRQLALRRDRGGAATPPGQLGQGAGRPARDPRRRDHVRLPRPEAAGGDGAGAQPRPHPGLVRLRRHRHRPLADRRARPRLAGGQPAGHRRRRCCAGATHGSATCSTGTSSRWACSTGRWLRSAPASWTSRGWSSPTRSSSRSPACSSCRGCRTCSARRT